MNEEQIASSARKGASKAQEAGAQVSGAARAMVYDAASSGQHLPSNWESSRFKLPLQLREAIPHVGEHETVLIVHNDAVVQGLSEAPFMKNVSPWGIFTIGTGLGNALFKNR